MYDIEKRSAVLENAAGFARQDYVYIYTRSRNKMAVLGDAHALRTQISRSLKCCTSRNALALVS